MDPRVIRLAELLALPDDESRYQAARMVLTEFTSKPVNAPIDSRAQADGYMLWFIRQLLNKGRYSLAGYLLWGDSLFNTKPGLVKLMWRTVPKHSLLLIMGSGACGKSYSIAAWCLLDWIRDPEYTCVKAISISKEHAQRNVFANMQSLHGGSRIALPGDRTATTIQVNDDDAQGIHLVAIPQGESGEGKLHGFHPKPRRGAIHPQFGNHSRVRALLDEAEEIPFGVWEGVENMLITKSDAEHVKVIAPANPKDKTSQYGLRCEPLNGWGSVTIEHSEEWITKMGGYCVRLDGMKCENVIERKVVYPGFLTWEGFQQYLTHGANSPEYFTMARGWFPDSGVAAKVIPWSILERGRGSYKFVGPVRYCAAADLALDGPDLAVLTVGRWGQVEGWNNLQGQYFPFFPLRYGLQVEQQFEMPKGDSEAIARTIMDHCYQLSIKPGDLGVDSTGLGEGVYSLLKMLFGPEVRAINYSTGSTDMKVMEDDLLPASGLYEGVHTELFFAVRKWLEFHFVKFGPLIQPGRLFKQLTDREYKQVGQGRVRIEKKSEYKKRNGGESPDYADSASILVMVARMSGEFEVSKLAPGQDISAGGPVLEPGVLDKLPYMDLQDY